MSAELSPEQVEAAQHLRSAWMESPNGRLLAAAEIPDWCVALAPTVAALIADAEQRGRVEAVASVAPVVEKWLRYLQNSKGDWYGSIKEIGAALGGAA